MDRETFPVTPLGGGRLGKGLDWMDMLEKFLAGRRLRMRWEEVPVDGDHGWHFSRPWAARHYKCELYGVNGDRPVTTIMPSDNGPPEVADVVDAVAAEAAVIEEARSYEEWALQMGVDPDSRRGELAYRRERRQARYLRLLLGEEGYRKLLWEVERL